MTNKDMIIAIMAIMATSGKTNVINAIKWISKDCKSQEEALENFLSVCKNSYDDIQKHGTESYICRDKSSAVDCATALFMSSAMANYITTLA